MLLNIYSVFCKVATVHMIVTCIIFSFLFIKHSKNKTDLTKEML